MKLKKILAIGMICIFVCSTGIVSSLNIDHYQPNLNDKDAYDLLIITPVDFTEELSPLVDHKNDMGMDTIIVTLDEVESSSETSDGQDLAEKMKYYIKYSIETHDISYVLLVGGRVGQSNDWYLPVRYVDMDNGWEAHYMSDLYFADIYDSEGGFSSWNDNDDTQFSEWVEGELPVDSNIDLYPDISIGRLPCRSESQVTDIVDKIIFYETNTNGQSWFSNILAIAGDTYLEIDNDEWVGYEGEEYADLAIDYMQGFDATRFYLSEGAFTGSSDIINAINQGFGFVYFVGHGNPRTWGNHPPNDHEFVDGLQNHEMGKLDNHPEYPVTIVSGCHNCQFDVHILNLLEGFLEDGLGFFSTRGGKVWRFEWVPECWGWRMTREADGGSIVTYGATALGHTKEDKSSFEGGINELEVEMFRQYGVEGTIHAGDVLKNAITWYLDTYPVDWSSTDETTLLDTWVDVQVAQSYVLIGDPSLRIGGYP